jgi:methyl-accepting chemotaxis protein
MANDLGNVDLVLALSWNISLSTTYALFLGCEPSDIKTIHTFVQHSSMCSAHPMLLIAAFADLQLNRFDNLHNEAFRQVEAAVHKAGLNPVDGPEVRATLKAEPQSQSRSEDRRRIDYVSLIRSVLRNFRSSGYLCQCIKQFRAQITQVMAAVNQLSTILLSNKGLDLQAQSMAVNGQLTQILSRYDDLIERSKLTTNESSVLMSAMWNILAHEDNETSQKLANASKDIAIASKEIAEETKKDSAAMKEIAAASKQIALESQKIAQETKIDSAAMRKIAASTKKDSAAMKSIALLTMLFLPPTFTAVSLLPLFL